MKRCIYCDFVSGIYDHKKAGAYIEALKKEMKLISPPLMGGDEGEGEKLSTLFIGGGSPTALSSDTLSILINHIFTNFSFTEDYEATIEANPRTVDKEKLQAIRSLGINRISIGVQSFNDDELAFLGRIHSSDDAEQAVHLARDAGFENIGIDLIYGIPGQSIQSWKMTLEKAARLKPKHISTYELTVEKGTLLGEYLKNPPSFPFFKGGKSSSLLRWDYGGCSPLWQRGDRGDFPIKSNLPDEDKIIEMYEHTVDYLTSEGYIHYEISNFALPGNQCRHNLNYWDRGEYYGVGLGAHSFINAERFRNTDDLEKYLNLVSENKSPVKESESITEDMALSEALFLGLRKTEGLNVESFSKRYKVNILSRHEKEIQGLQEAGLIEITNSGCSYETSIKLTRRGLLLSNEVFTRLI
ncbi:MAG: radical SAM protein [Nitrospirae bacterium]|nr:radical SAM protein [Nitrospirota bacterium]